METGKKYFYRPAYLSKGNRWQIIFYALNPNTGDWERHRETWDINRVQDLKERERHAKKIIQRLNRELLPAGYPYQKPEPKATLTIAAAFDLAAKIKISTDKEETARTYKGISSVFCKYVEARRIGGCAVESFTQKNVVDFSDWLVIERKVNARTHNKYLGHLHAIFQELVKREKIAQNPFSHAERKKMQPAKIRVFTDDEKKVVAGEIQKNDRWLWYWILFEYHLFIRGRELRRLQFADVNLVEGYVYLAAHKTKNGKERFCTIPKSILPEFLSADFVRHPANYLIFGQDFRPHPRKAVGVNTANSRHRQILEKLKLEGKIEDFTGISVYSWKYTGITEDVNAGELTITDIQAQADHHSPTQTLVYHRKPKVNPRIRESSRSILK